MPPMRDARYALYPFLFAPRKNQYAQIAELRRLRRERCDAVFGDAFVRQGKALQRVKRRFGRDAFVYQAGGDCGGHKVERARQYDEIAAARYEMLSEFAQAGFVSVPRVQP